MQPRFPFTINTVNNEFEIKHTMGIEPNETRFFTMQGNYEVLFVGNIINSDVVQLLTPAGLRREHPIATILSWHMDPMPTYMTGNMIAQALGTVQGAFAFVLVSNRGDRILLCINNLPFVWTPQGGKYVDQPQRKLYLLAPGQPAIDWDLPVGREQAKLYVSARHADDWPTKFGFRKKLDTHITYSTIDYKYSTGIRSVLSWTEFLVQTVRFAQELPSKVGSIVIGAGPEHFDLLTANTLSRLVFVISNKEILLECPIYNRSISTRTATILS